MAEDEQCPDDPETKRFVTDVLSWLDDEKTHLGDRSHRKVLELLAHEHATKIRKREVTRTRGKDLVLLASVVTIALSLGPKILSVLGVLPQ